jgi:hypothetical protein
VQQRSSATGPARWPPELKTVDVVDHDRSEIYVG